MLFIVENFLFFLEEGGGGKQYFQSFGEHGFVPPSGSVYARPTLLSRNGVFPASRDVLLARKGAFLPMTAPSKYSRYSALQ